MKEYPSIPQSTGNTFQEIQGALVFDKLDGSSMRSEWTRKKGWHKHGKRHGLLDDSNPHLVQVPELFLSTIAPMITEVAVNKRWQHLVVFHEFWGKLSFAGNHVQDDPKFVTLFDVAVDKKGIMGPAEFLRIFGNYDGLIPAYLGTHNLTRGFVERVRAGDLPGITFEGIVAKAGTGHDIVRAKAKTQAWIDKVRALHGKDADRIISS